MRLHAACLLILFSSLYPPIQKKFLPSKGEKEMPAIQTNTETVKIIDADGNITETTTETT